MGFTILGFSRSAYLTDPAWVQQNRALIAKAARGEATFPARAENPLKIFSAQASSLSYAYDNFRDEDIAPGSIAIIPVEGPIFKTGGMCSYGCEDYARWTHEADANPNISKIIYQIDSPGGQSDGPAMVADAIRKCSTPTVAYIYEGMAASAAYWIAAACDEVVMSRKTDMAGSIGVYVELADWDKFYEGEGLTIHTIYADQSTEKNDEIKKALAGDYKPIKTKLLNPIAAAFIEAVETYRPQTVGKGVSKGGIYMGQEAIDNGLVDRIASLDEIISESNTNQNNNRMSLKNWLSGIAGSEKTEVVATVEELEQLRTDMQAAQQTLEKQAALLQNALQQNEALEKQNANFQAENEALKAEVEKLGKQPGEKPGAQKKEGDKIEAEGVDLNSLAHNRKADSLLGFKK